MKKTITLGSDSIHGFDIGEEFEKVSHADLHIEYKFIEGVGFRIDRAHLIVFTDKYRYYVEDGFIDREGCPNGDIIVDKSDVVGGETYGFDITDEYWEYQLEPDPNNRGELYCERVEFQDYPNKNIIEICTQ